MAGGNGYAEPADDLDEDLDDDPTDDLEGPGTALQPAEPAPDEPDSEATDLPASLIEEWDKAGGTDFHLEQARAAANVVLEALPDSDRFVQSFDNLPEGARSAVFSEIALMPGGSVKSASEADLQRFATTPEGAELARQWRGKAGRKLGHVRASMERIMSRMTADDNEAVGRWFDDLPPDHAKAVIRVLAGER